MNEFIMNSWQISPYFPSILCLVSQPVCVLVISFVVDSEEEAENVDTCSRYSILRYSVEYIVLVFFQSGRWVLIFPLSFVLWVNKLAYVLVIPFAVDSEEKAENVPPLMDTLVCFSWNFWNVKGIIKGCVKNRPSVSPLPFIFGRVSLLSKRFNL